MLSAQPGLAGDAGDWEQIGRLSRPGMPMSLGEGCAIDDGHDQKPARGLGFSLRAFKDRARRGRET
jgi:hypothetical protein